MDKNNSISIKMALAIALFGGMFSGLIVGCDNAQAKTESADLAAKAFAAQPQTMKDFQVSEPEGGYIVMYYAKQTNGVYYVAVCPEGSIKPYLKPDGSLPNEWSSAPRLEGEILAFSGSFAGAPYAKGTRVKLQRARYGGTNVTFIAGLDNDKK